MWLVALLGCLVAFSPALTPQERDDPDGPEAVIKSLAEAFKDKRTIEQIKKDNALIRAAAKGDLDAIRKTLKDGALINSRYLDGFAFIDEGESGYTALMFAILNKRTDAIKLLLEHKPDLEVQHYEGDTALSLAVFLERKEAIELLVKAGAKGDPAKMRLTINLLRAACKGFSLGERESFPPYPGSLRTDKNTPDIATVLKQGADINGIDPKGYTALMYAANLGLVENVKTLLAKGADATLKTPDGHTALSLAERESDYFKKEERRQVVKLLKEYLEKKR